MLIKGYNKQRLEPSLENYWWSNGLSTAVDRVSLPFEDKHSDNKHH